MRNNLSKLNSFYLTLAVTVAAILVCNFTAEPSRAENPDRLATEALATKRTENAAAKTTLHYSREIDRLVRKQLDKDGIERNAATDDATFLRRVYLNAIGRIPNIDEAESFLGSDSSQKRAQLIDELLGSYGYVSHQFNFWADILRIQSRNNVIVGQPYIDFVKDSLEQNKPYDEFVRELLASEGAAMEKGNGAVGYYLRDINMPEDNMSNTIRVFLGTRLECAQCHDHPFDKWTQKQYFEMVAFTGGMKYSAREGNTYKEMKMLRRELLAKKENMNGELLAAANRAMRSITSGVSGGGTGLARLPETYEGTDGAPNEVITAKTMFESDPLVAAKVPQLRGKNKKKKRKINNKARQMIPGAVDLGSRQAYAQWLTDVDNPRFAKVIANRLWKQAFGLGLIEPVDVIEDNTLASNPELLDYLTKLMIEIDFDMQQFLRIVYNSETWQAEATRTDIAEPHKYAFPGPVLRRMSAEQIWDSMVGLTVDAIDQRDYPEANVAGVGRVDVYKFYDDVKDKSAREFYDFMAQKYGVWGKNKRKNGGDAMMSDSDPQQMRKAMQKKLADADRAARRKQRKEHDRLLKAMNEKVKQAKRSGNQRLLRELLIERTEVVSAARTKSGKFMRASELPSPAPARHLLREFGQSDREVIENANDDPAVTQVLRLMNGFVDDTIGNDANSVLTRNALLADSQQEGIQNVYLTMLSRKPTRVEVREWLPDFRSDARAAYTDLVWTLINSNEFIFVR